jgi:hypothetical protein
MNKVTCVWLLHLVAMLLWLPLVADFVRCPEAVVNQRWRLLTVGPFLMLFGFYNMYVGYNGRSR